MTVTVCSASQAQELIARGECDAIISISSPPGSLFCRRPNNIHLVEQQQQFTFDDLADPESEFSPNKSSIENLIVGIRKYHHLFLDPDQRLIIHCFAGEQRSTAAAYIGWADLLGPGQEDWAWGHAYRCSTNNSRFNPNYLFVSLADAILNRDGKLLSML